ncbi:hypothetical protein ES332_A12G031000v1 [Gossypium tomentosum]|uniref:Uncharacterized protein n=1 Tax=Gossypium tomentosum TaxID=34277 RepID=A0A5D2MS37_GOSTO|nr:hypothetical protein ES332_A12G031000v1 [Gossypium tomentosum]
MGLPPTLNKKNRELSCSLPISFLFYFLLGFQRNPSLPPFNCRATSALGGRRYTKMGSFSSPIFYLLEASVEVVENEGRETWAKTWSGVYGDPVWSADVGVEFVVC